VISGEVYQKQETRSHKVSSSLCIVLMCFCVSAGSCRVGGR
jgi:hypothetical protein